MRSVTYSFIDIAVLDEVRQRFAAGDALAILSTDLEQVVWANGAGAAVFGYPDIEAIIGSAARLPLVARRQIMATAGYPEIGRDKGVVLRLASGISSRAVSFLASSILLPSGDQAVLLTVPASRAASRNAGEIAEGAIGGLNEPGHFAALVDASGAVFAASDGFAELGVTVETLGTLVREVRNEADRLVKRLIPAKRGRLPAGFARLTDEPALHLLIVVDEVQAVAETSSGEGTPAAVSKPSPADDLTGEQADIPSALLAKRGIAPVRFVWRTDPEGRFSAISPEFATAVGAEAADIVGRGFRDVSIAFGFDPAGEIPELLERRDTWSGRTVLWPVAGAGLRIPVDLAALPVYGRDRNFEGFRGFGVARGGDAIDDPEALGLVLTSNPAAVETPGELVTRTYDEDGAAGSEADEGGRPDEPLKGDLPGPDRRAADKVIRLAEHRVPAGERACPRLSATRSGKSASG